MWPISDRFAESLGKSHFVAVKAEILENETVLAELATEGALCDGSVKCDRSAIQRTADVTLVDRDGTLTPRDIGDLLVPAGRQIRLWRGIMFNDRLPGGVADVEYVPIGTFRFTEVDVQYPAIRLTKCFDRAWIISGEKLPFNVAINQNTNVVDTVIQLVQTAYPGVPMNFPITNENTNGMVFDAESDPWEACQTLFANLGLRLYFDPMGVLTARPEPSESDPIVWSYDDTDPTNLGLPNVGRTWTGDGYNGVTVVAENSDLAAPIRAFAYDSDPLSPTQWGGPYGKRMAPFIRDETIASVAQAQLRADKELQANLGFLQSITVPALVNPALEIGDVVRIAYTRTDTGEDPIIKESSNILDSFEIPMRAMSTHTLGTRARRIVFNG
jgi:hypothetical protein